MLKVRYLLPVLLVAAALVPSVWLLWINLDMPYLGAHDDGIYWTCSRALSEGKGYRIAHLPGEPYQTKFPPLYPAYLSAAPTIAAAAIATWLWLPLFALLSYFALEELALNRQVRALISAIILVNPVCIWASTRLVAELMFASFVMATAIAARRSISRPTFALVAGVLASCACLTKTAGLPILVVLPAFLFVRTRSVRAPLLSVSVMLPSVGSWFWWSSTHHDSRIAYQYYVDYFGWFAAEFGIADLPKIIAVNAPYLLRGMGNLAVLSMSFGHDLVSIAAAAIGCFGLAKLIGREGAGFLALFACGYVPVLLAWNFVPGERFLLPLLPLITAGLCSALESVCRLGLPIAAVVTALALLSAGDRLAANARSAASDLDVAAGWIVSNTPQDSSVLTSYDVQLYLRTERHTYRPALPVGFQYRQTPSRLDAIAGIPDLCRREHIQYYLRLPQDNWFRADDPEERKAVDSVLQRSFEPVFSTSVATVYRLNAAPQRRTASIP